jgi:hypothetical protein
MGNLSRKIELLAPVTTSGAFASLGASFLYATLFIWYQLRINPDWESSLGYLNYINSMNIVAFAPASILVILLILCLQRRSVSIITASIYTGITLLAAFSALVAGYGKFAVAVITVGASVYQFGLLLRLLTGRDVFSEKKRAIEKAGSLILHIGYSILVFSWVSLNGTEYEIPIFWSATIAVITGTALSFYGSILLKLHFRK